MVKGKSVFKSTTMPVGLLHIFKELTSNVGDNVDNSRLAGVDPGECTVVVKGARITVTSCGLCIPIKMRKGQLIPEMIFGDMHSGSSLGEDRTTGGAHGIGAKATGILSNEFKVVVSNANQKKMCTIVWKNNYSIKEDAVIEEYDGEESSVEISYIASPKVFGYQGKQRAYEQIEVESFHWICACLSLTARIPVTFNGIRMEYTTETFAKTFIQDTDGDDWKMPKHFIIELEKEPAKPNMPSTKVRAIIMDSPNKSVHLGFANHIVNTSGGVHVNAPVKCLKEQILKHLRAKDDTVKIDIRDIKAHLTVIISVTGVLNPEWGGGQAKTSMTSPNIPMEITDKQLKGLKTWGLFTALNAAISAKTLAGLGEVDATKRKGKFILTKRGEDATLAGTKQGYLCTAAIVEGNSAEGYFANLLDFMEGGKRTNGVIVLRGKPLNVLKCTDADMLKNEEMNEIVSRLGLKAGVEYTDVKQLRYGKLMIMTDADLDGQHIKALILGLFHRLWPSLLKLEGFVVDYMTPYLRLTKGKQTLKFFYESQYDTWKHETDNEVKGWTERYFKGLGASEVEDIKADYEDLHEVKFRYDRKAGDNIEMTLGPSKIHGPARKEWIRAWDSTKTKDIVDDRLPISTFIDSFFRPYSYSTIARNMPSLADGMTNVNRKIVHGAFEKWGRKCTSKALVKVNDFAGFVGTLTKYHHGDSIQSSVINMGQTHIGSNNVPLLTGKGRFGSMERGGKHAAEPRYLEVCASPLLPYIFRQEDDDLLTPSYSEGHRVEPEFYLPIIPMALVNGVDSVSTGWRSKIPSYDPLMLIDTYLARLDGTKFKEPQPFYRDHRGKNSVELGKFTSVGTAEDIKTNSYVVTCLPVGVWNNKYYKMLMKWVIAGKISDFESECTATKTRFIVKGYDVVNEVGLPRKLKIDDLGITSHQDLSNITLKSPTGFPDEYSNVRTVMECFYEFRLAYYIPRKDMMIKHIQAAIDKANKKLKYITACYKGDLAFTSGDKKPIKRQVVLDRIADLGLEKGFYIRVDGYTIVNQCECDEDGIKLLKQTIESLTNELELLNSKSHTDLWREDLLELRSQYLKIYNEDGTLKVKPKELKDKKVVAKKTLKKK
jgi:DNA topoisomerase-2